MPELGKCAFKQRQRVLELIVEQLLLHQRRIHSKERILAQQLQHDLLLFGYYEFLLNLGHSLAFQFTNKAEERQELDGSQLALDSKRQ